MSCLSIKEEGGTEVEKG